MLGMMEIGLCSYEAPIYTLSTLTEHRNEARCNAVTNAMEKAKLMVAALGEDVSMTLGRPIAINDIPRDIQDDAADSFVANPWFVPLLSRGVMGSTSCGDRSGSGSGNGISVSS